MLASIGGRSQCACSVLKHRLPWPILFASAAPLPSRSKAMCSNGRSLEFGSGPDVKSADRSNCTASPSRKRRQSAVAQLNLLGQPTTAAAPKVRITKQGPPQKSASSKPSSSGRRQTKSSPRVPAEQGSNGVTDLGEQAAVNYLPTTWSPDVGRTLLKQLQASLP